MNAEPLPPKHRRIVVGDPERPSLDELQPHVEAGFDVGAYDVLVLDARLAASLDDLELPRWLDAVRRHARQLRAVIVVATPELGAAAVAVLAEVHPVVRHVPNIEDVRAAGKGG